MLDSATLERRLEAIERAVADLPRERANGSAPPNWIEKVSGIVTDDEEFLEMLKLGRAFRDADRPPDEPGDEP